ncbi:MAG: response regulator transcription factor [Burkholderiaceae bacterium]|nr:response regulator transcription factor [Burkholderiaceae bacterium]
MTPLLLTTDTGLLNHWCQGLQIKTPLQLHSFAELLSTVRRAGDMVWLDLSVSDIPPWNDAAWTELIKVKNLRLVAASSNPKDSEAITALDTGCAAYCHAYSDIATLRQVHQVTEAGHVWIGANLMQQLIQSANRIPPARAERKTDWDTTLTQREKEVAEMAAHGASNQAIADECGISERTVKAHLSAVFEKLGIADRLALALKVHGIQ